MDFVVTTPTDELILIQACVDMNDEQTRERELSALCSVCAEFGLTEGWVITEDHEEEVDRQGINVHCVPFWKWAQ